LVQAPERNYRALGAAGMIDQGGAQGSGRKDAIHTASPITGLRWVGDDIGRNGNNEN
jgi:hypothetical protein